LSYRLSWEADGANWPNREASRFLRAGGLNWHVQDFGQTDAPVALLVHGTGAATHSWKDVAPLLAKDWRVIAMDLPGHGFTDRMPGGRASIEGMADALGALCKALDIVPSVSAGHSAGAVILLAMHLRKHLPAAPIVSFNGALLPLGGMTGAIFSPLAKLLALNPVVPSLMSRHLRHDDVLKRMLDQTGSRINDEGRALYRLLAGNPGHIAGAVEMMANWDLPGFQRLLPRIDVPVVLVAGGRDRTIPPVDAERAQKLIPVSSLVRLPNLGHLAHEEDPEAAVRIIRDAASAVSPT
jgi:magnesium chelatase accessory protein